MKIVCGTDFSEQAVRASEAAAQLARRWGDTIALVHVIEPARPAFGVPESSSPTLHSAAGKVARAALSEAVDALRRTGVTVEMFLREGRAPEEIVEAAREANARWIVVGTHGRQGATRWLMGSIAERTMQLADRPVLVFRGDSDGFRAWADGERALHVAVGTDADQPLATVLDAVGDLRAAGPCDTTFVQVVPAMETSGEISRAVEERLVQKTQKLPGKGSVAIRLFPNLTTLPDSLRLFARVHALDLLIVGTHQRHGLQLWREGSVSRDLVREATVSPVLYVPLREAEELPAEKRLPAMRTVLCPTDFSELANRAVPYAYSLARAEAGVVVLCHVYEKVAPISGGAPPETLAPESRARFEEHLRELVPRDAELHGVSTHVLILEGPTVDRVIAETAERLGVDAICMGSHGRSALGRTLLGSVAERVVHGSRRPVLIVR